MGKPKCSTCGETDPTKFYGHKTRSCKRCHNTYTKKKYLDNKEWAVQLLGGCCSSCGYNKNLAALEFHHTDPTIKDPKWGTILNRSRTNIEKELRGCILLCSNCHHEHHNPHLFRSQPSRFLQQNNYVPYQTTNASNRKIPVDHL